MLRFSKMASWFETDPINASFQDDSLVQFHVRSLRDVEVLNGEGVVHHLIIHPPKNDNLDEILLRLSFSLTARNEIQYFSFRDLRISELGHLFLATTFREGKDVLLHLEFRNCYINCVVAVAIRYMLQKNMISELIFSRCTFEREVEDHFEGGLTDNTSLEKISCVSCRNDGAPEIVRCFLHFCTNNLLHVSLTLVSNETWDSLRDFLSRNEQLQSLFLYTSVIDRAAMDTIILNCITIEGLKCLGFKFCDINPNGLIKLFDTIVKFKFLNVLCLDTIPNSMFVGVPSNLQLDNLVIE